MASGKLPACGPDEVRAYCANLCQALLDALARGDRVTLSRQDDTEPAPGHDRYGDGPADYVYNGTTLTIKIGRPALLDYIAFERDRAILLARLGGR